MTEDLNITYSDKKNPSNIIIEANFPLKIGWNSIKSDHIKTKSNYLNSSSYEGDKFDGLVNHFLEDLTNEKDSEADTIKEATMAVQNVMESITEEADSKEHQSFGLLEVVNSESLP